MKPSIVDPPPTPRLPHRRRHPDPFPRLPHRRSTDALATSIPILAPPSSSFGCVWLIAEAEPQRRRCCIALLRFAGGRESRPTFSLLASASASFASPLPAAAVTAAPSLLLSGELGDSLAAESAAPPASARPRVQALAKELVQSRKEVNHLYENKA
ncbi:uncharacterized protein LOC125535529 [Triticum urartu]|uniref:uncharacterized protein LOC125535529 n=1 Tax=Triticum urartu TaxID=4572 RepID=UPI0020431D41|nr:uncharacterized protein LOC125535529 [Triticum urartu]XP_048554551.1 uncharacterized protein LOC125535529 [Triticum urartu]